ncbi:MAG TPA: CPBP family intramembrane glutamic endopeptidase [Steroidobacteraceae bacterium]|nr:CPBP family intramembrane glutamic endopeptidase [Steroidobacteraceae bacterium]
MTKPRLSLLLVGDDGKLRPIFRALIYAALAFWLLSADEFLGTPIRRAATALHATALSAGTDAFYETINLLTALLLTWLFGLYEGRRVDEYGLPIRQAFGARYWEGFAIGIASAGGVALGIVALGGMTVHGLALHGVMIGWAALAWLGSNVLVGIAEEYLFRGYLLQTLWKSLGFWPAAVLIALWFGADHYFFKRGENVWDLISLVSFGIWTCYTVLRTGSLWLAAGYHAAFDYMQLFVIGTPNGSVAPVNHLLNVSFQGPDWVTGGVLGTEASFLIYPVIALMFIYIGWRQYDSRART